MRKICVLLISLFCINTLYAQTASYKSVRKNKLSGTLDTYITGGGDSISIGDQIILGSTADFENYFNLQQIYIDNEENTQSTLPVSRYLEGYVFIIDSIFVKKRVIKLITKGTNQFKQILVKNVELAFFNKEILIRPLTKKFPYYYNDSIVGYYTNDNFNQNRIYYTSQLIDSIKQEIQSSKPIKIKSSASESSASESSKVTAKFTNSSFYLKKAGEMKNTAIITGVITAILGGIVLSSNDPNNPDSNPSKIATPIFAIGGLISLTLDVVGNNALIKAGEAMELEKIKQFEAKNNNSTTHKP